MKFFQVKSVEETYQLIEEKVKPLVEKINIPLLDALHYVLAEDVVTKENVPNFRRSSVDGYALRAEDTFGASESMPGFLSVVGEVRMGQEVTTAVNFGEAIYVPTGGMVPDECDAVIMIEHCEDLSGLLNVYRQVTPGENVIRIGEDVRMGELLLPKGRRLRSQELGALAAQGITDVTVWRKPVIGYLSTGDEIVPMNVPHLQIGEVRDINVMTIGSIVRDSGHIFQYAGIVSDNVEDLTKRMKEWFDKVDFLILSGGSSVGTKDHSMEVIESLGKPGVFVHGVAIKPGKPTIIAAADGKPVLGLPGHPASAMIIFQLFGIHILQCLQGVKSFVPECLKAEITKNIPSAPGRTDFVRVSLENKDGKWLAEPIFGKSGLLSTLVKSDGLVEIPSPSEGMTKGTIVHVRLFK
jgi:molybdopterin molybdotransferase